jgi:hypothetical protein
VPNKQVLYLPVKWHGKYAEVAQLVEQLICNQQVVGSTPFLGSNYFKPKSLRFLGSWPSG